MATRKTTARAAAAQAPAGKAGKKPSPAKSSKAPKKKAATATAAAPGTADIRERVKWGLAALGEHLQIASQALPAGKRATIRAKGHDMQQALDRLGKHYERLLART